MQATSFQGSDPPPSMENNVKKTRAYNHTDIWLMILTLVMALNIVSTYYQLKNIEDRLWTIEFKKQTVIP